jgi:hypothetical protein
VRGHDAATGRWALELLASGERIHTGPEHMVLAVVPVGLAVGVHGLVGAPQHNGKHGVVTGRVGSNGRCRVQLAGVQKPLGLRLANIEMAPEPELQPGPEPSATRGDSVVDSDVQQGGRFADATRGRSQAEIVAAVRSADPSWLCASAGAPRDVGVDAPGHQCEPSVGN